MSIFERGFLLKIICVLFVLFSFGIDHSDVCMVLWVFFGVGNGLFFPMRFLCVKLGCWFQLQSFVTATHIGDS